MNPAKYFFSCICLFSAPAGRVNPTSSLARETRAYPAWISSPGERWEQSLGQVSVEFSSKQKGRNGAFTASEQ